MVSQDANKYPLQSARHTLGPFIHINNVTNRATCPFVRISEVTVRYLPVIIVVADKDPLQQGESPAFFDGSYNLISLVGAFPPVDSPSRRAHFSLAVFFLVCLRSTVWNFSVLQSSRLPFSISFFCTFARATERTVRIIKGTVLISVTVGCPLGYIDPQLAAPIICWSDVKWFPNIPFDRPLRSSPYVTSKAADCDQSETREYNSCRKSSGPGWRACSLRSGS